MRDTLVSSHDNEPTVYTKSRKEFSEDFRISDTYKESMIQRLEEKLSESLFGDITLGNNVLSRDFARDYLSYLKDGGEFGIQGFYRYVWNPSTKSNKILPDHHE